MFTLTISTANAAFDDQPATEIARILRDVAKRVEDGELSGNLRDVNGNGVGAFDSGDGD